jgi:hypothetical protein
MIEEANGGIKVPSFLHKDYLKRLKLRRFSFVPIWHFGTLSVVESETENLKLFWKIPLKTSSKSPYAVL